MPARASILIASLIAPSSVLLVTAARPMPANHPAAHKPAAHAATPQPDGFATQIEPLVQKYCAMCHGASSPSGGICLVTDKSTAAIVKDRNVWEQVSMNVGSHHMPPKAMPQPTDAERDKLVTWIDTTLSQADCKIKDPGRVTMRRLNRLEYNSTIRDLVGPLQWDGKDYQPADDFPSDDVGYGFDNIGDVLTISPLLMEKVMTAAERISRAAIVAPEDAAKPVKFAGDSLAHAGGQPYSATGGRILATNGELGVNYDFPAAGDYVLRASAFGQQAGAEPAKMAFLLDGKPLRTVDVPAVEAAPDEYQVRTRVPAGVHRFAVAFTNDFYDPKNPDPSKRDRNLIVNALQVTGPIALPADLPETHRRIVKFAPHAGSPLTPEQCARKDLAAFASRAYRRPATAAEVERLVRCAQLAWKNGESFERGIQLGVEATLVSPNFLFHVESDHYGPNGGASRAGVSGHSGHGIRTASLTTGQGPAVRPLNDYELASRLSYFLWSSMPDDALFRLAGKGVLSKPEVLAAQVKRMLADKKAEALGDSFAMQWLTLRNLALVQPNPRQFHDFNNTLRQSMLTETRMFFDSVVHDDRPVLDFIAAKYDYLNGPLAKHYGVPGVDGDQFRRVELTGDMADQRGGLLSQASILTVTSNPTRTSPVKRGKWVLEQLLGTPPPPPPPGAGILKDEGRQLRGTLRQRMEQHRKDPNCASCHARMDPIGFGLENYDATGAWRTLDAGQPIDASGTLPDGKSFNGPTQLKQILLSKKTLFVHNLANKLMTYALGRGLEVTDNCSLDAIVRASAKENYRFSSLVTQVVMSEPFRQRRVDAG